MYVPIDEIYTAVRNHFNKSRNPDIMESDIDAVTNSQLERMIETGEIIALDTHYPKNEEIAKNVREISSARYFRKGIEPKEDYDLNPLDNIIKYFQRGR